MNTTLFAVLLLCAATVNGLSCGRCYRHRCKTPRCYYGVGTVLDICGCCQICGQGVGEKCGGPWDIYGKCDSRSKCWKTSLCDRHIDINSPGICVPADFYDKYEEYRKIFSDGQPSYGYL